MIEPYAVVGLSPRTFTVEKREEALANTKRICKFMDTACMVGGWEGFPVRLVVIPEMAIQGMVSNTPGNRAAEARFAVEIPGPETEELGRKAKEINTYIAAELYMVRDNDFPDRYYNVAFIVSPKGEVIYKRYKATSDAYEGGMLGNSNPHDVWDEWIKKKGNGNVMDAIYPVARTEIGNIGICICHEGVYPEIVRGLAMNGAEIIIRPTLIEPAYYEWNVGVTKPRPRNVQPGVRRCAESGTRDPEGWRRRRSLRRTVDDRQQSRHDRRSAEWMDVGGFFRHHCDRHGIASKDSDGE